MNKCIDLDGKVAFVTGASHGIGLGIAHAFIAAGMKVVITYRTKSHADEAVQELAHAAERVHAIEVDVTDRAGMARAAEETVQRFGKVHILVNNAGLGVLAGLSSARLEVWDEAWNVNVNGVFNGIHAFLPKIKSHGEGGHIVTTASTAGLVAGPAGVYSTTKFAVVGMMESLRQELLDTNIGVSVFCPGAVSTDAFVMGADGEKCAGGNPTPGNGKKPAGMEPLEAGQRVLQGIRNNALYIFSHPEFAPGIRDRNEALLASFPRETPPAERVELERPLLRSPVYIREIERLRG